MSSLKSQNHPYTGTDLPVELEPNYITTQINFSGFDTDAVQIEYLPARGTPPADYVVLPTDAAQKVVTVDGVSLSGLRFTGTATGTIYIQQR